MAKKISLATAFVAVAFVSYWLGSQTWCFDKGVTHFNTEDARLGEVRLSNAILGSLRSMYHDNPQWWNDVFMESDEYARIDEALQGDWEDFYAP